MDYGLRCYDDVDRDIGGVGVYLIDELEGIPYPDFQG